LPEEVLADVEHDKNTIEKVIPSAGGGSLSTDASEGLPWFETMVEGSRLGKMRRQRERREGKGWRVEWEIVEWTDADEETPATTVSAKRKLGERVDDDDVSMN